LNQSIATPILPQPPRTKTLQARKETLMNATTDPTDETETKETPAQAETAQIPLAEAPQLQPDAGMPMAAAPDANAIRAEAAEVAEVCAQAAKLGVAIDAADAVKRGLKPEALRAQVLENLAAQSDATSIVASAPAAAAAKDSPLIAAAKQAATDATR
jgi:hypothetical protein